MSVSRISNKFQYLACLFTLAVGACDLNCAAIDPGANEGRVDLFALHHGSAEDGEEFPPDLADHPDWRVFWNDDGQEVKLADGFRSFTGVQIIACDGLTAYPTDFQFDGPRAESFCDTPDIESSTLGWASLPPGQYCDIEIEYGPYEFPTNSDAPTPDVPGMDGMTAMIRVAEGEEEANPRFSWSDGFELTVKRTLANVEDGSALNIQPGDTSSNRIGITITYDRLLDGVDLSQADPDVEKAVKDGLRKYTGVMWGNALRDPAAISYDE